MIEDQLRGLFPYNAGNGTFLQTMYARDVRRNMPRSVDEFCFDFDQANATWFSQNGEDGIVQFLLAQMDGSTKRCIEIGAGDGIENNTTNLAIHHGYRALMVDPSWALEHVASAFFSRIHTTRERPPVLLREFAEPSNVDEIVTKAGFDGEVDVLSIDVDGNDYWLFEALTVVQPRIVILELNLQLGPDVSVAMPYTPGYAYWDQPVAGRLGASVRAYDALARRKGLVFVGCDRARVNGFWVRRGLLPAVPDGVGLDRIWAGRVRSEGAIAHQQHLLTTCDWVDIEA